MAYISTLCEDRDSLTDKQMDSNATHSPLVGIMNKVLRANHKTQILDYATKTNYCMKRKPFYKYNIHINHQCHFHDCKRLLVNLTPPPIIMIQLNHEQ